MPTVVTKLSHLITHPSMREVIPDGVTRTVSMEDIKIRAVAHRQRGHRIHIAASAFGEHIGPKNPGPKQFRDYITVAWVERTD